MEELAAAKEVDSKGLLCAQALKSFTEKGKCLLELAETQSKEGSLQDYIRLQIRIEQKQSLLGLIDAAAELFRSLSVKTLKDAEELWKSHSPCTGLSDALLAFEQLELQWDHFLQRLDQDLQLSPGTEQCHPQSISPHLPLTCARSGREVMLGDFLKKDKKLLLVLIRQFSCLFCRLHLKELHKHQKLLQSQDVQVVVVSFGCRDGAAHWIKETNCEYDMVLDPQRQLYIAFSLGSSLWKVLNFRNMLVYGEHVAQDMEFPKELPSIQDDMFQLGGDFVLDEHGTVLFSHCCQSPIDRPSVYRLLSGINS